jgi:hypothetical protein
VQCVAGCLRAEDAFPHRPGQVVRCAPLVCKVLAHVFALSRNLLVDAGQSRSSFGRLFGGRYEWSPPHAFALAAAHAGAEHRRPLANARGRRPWEGGDR